jgi:hypothetical protein
VHATKDGCGCRWAVYDADCVRQFAVSKVTILERLSLLERVSVALRSSVKCMMSGKALTVTLEERSGRATDMVLIEFEKVEVTQAELVGDWLRFSVAARSPTPSSVLPACSISRSRQYESNEC